MPEARSQARLCARVEILNTGHLGYSPEQYYCTLLEYAGRFPPRFVVVSLFANDFGDFQEVLQGRGDWQEGKLLAGPDSGLLFRRNLDYVIVPAPWVNQIEGPQMAGQLPRQDLQHFGSGRSRISRPDRRIRQRPARDHEQLQTPWPGLAGKSAFNGRIGDGHFSAAGSRDLGRRRRPQRGTGPLDQGAKRASAPRIVDQSRRLFSDHLDQHTLGPAPVEFAVKDLLPRAEIEFPVRDRDDDLAAHDLAFVVGVGVILAGAVMVISLGRRVEWRELLQPAL